MVSRTEAIMFFETKATREKWLDRFAVSNLPIDVFCEMNHIKKEMLVKTLVKLFDDEPEYEQNPREITIRLEKALKMLEAANSIIQRQQKEITDQQIKIDAQKVLIQKKEEELSKTQTEINQINRVIDKKNKEINKKNLELEQKQIEIEQKRIEIIQLQEKLATQLRYRFCAHSEKMDNQPSLENGKTIEIHLDFMQGSNKDFTMTSTLLKEAGVSFTKNDSETLLSDELTEKLIKRFAVVHMACAYPHDSFSYNPD